MPTFPVFYLILTTTSEQILNIFHTIPVAGLWRCDKAVVIGILIIATIPSCHNAVTYALCTIQRNTFLCTKLLDRCFIEFQKKVSKFQNIIFLNDRMDEKLQCMCCKSACQWFSLCKKLNVLSEVIKVLNQV